MNEMKIGDLVEHYDQLYPGLGLVVDIAECHDNAWNAASALVRFCNPDKTGDTVAWISIDEFEVVNEGR